MMALSMDLRERMVKAYMNQEGSLGCIAKRFNVTFKTVDSLVKRLIATGHCRPKKPTGSIPIVQKQDKEKIKRWIQKRNDITLRELCTKLAKETGVIVKKSTMHNVCQLLRLRYKKNAVSSRAEKQ